jgi:BMFP domain-containing protein YqiC
MPPSPAPSSPPNKEAPLKSANIHTGKQLSRRTTLQAGGVALGLPLLDAMSPAFAKQEQSPKARRFVGISLALGLHGPNLEPEQAGPDYKPSRYLKSLQDIRQDFTVVSGSSHPGVVGGHTAEGSIYSACPNTRGATSRNTISLDQLMAKHLGHETRYPSLVLNAGTYSSPCYTENGAMIPAINDPVALFKKLFINDTKDEQKRQSELITRGRNIMDVVALEAKSLQKQLGAGDRAKLDEWFTSVNQLEKRLTANQEWIRRPKPKVNAKAPTNYDRNNVVNTVEVMLEVMNLALQSDSTRFITLHISSNSVKGIDGVSDSYHSLSHHGKDEDKLRQLAIVEQGIIDKYGNFLRQLKQHSQNEKNLLDETMVFMTSNLGNASNHNNKNMPVLFGGGGFKHGRHLAFDQKNNYPLPKLYVNALQQLGLPFEKFSRTKGTMQGLV